jgi:ribonuclease HIII
MMMIGADEVGVGDTFCGLVVSAASLTEEQGDRLQSSRVRDSKRISDSMIGQYVGILTEAGVRHSTVALDPDRLNSMMSDQMNHVEIQNWMFDRAIGKLIQKVGPPDRVVVDQFPGAKITLDHQPIEMIPRADEKYACVAAASIMARSAYLGMRKSLVRELGMEIPLGNSNAREALRALIRKEVDLSRYAKMYPNNVKAALREAR